MVKRIEARGGAALLLSLAVSLLAVGAQAEDRLIRLRAGPIATPEPAAVPAQPRMGEAPVSGLFLIQFTNRWQESWRADLRARGTTLLNYVPDDSFVARMNQTALNGLRALPFVRWVGEYQPQHKIDPRLSRALAADLQARRPVKFLLAPDANPVSTAQLMLRVPGIVRQQTLSLGTTCQATVNAAQLRDLARSDAVLWLEPAPRPKLVDEVSTKIVAGDTGVAGSPARVQELGFDGRGVTVAVVDSGLDSGDVTDMHPDLAGRVDALIAYDNLPDASDEHGHGSHCAGIVAGNGATGEKDDNGQLWGLGVAPAAHVVVQRIFDGTGDYRPAPSNARLVQDAVRAGAYIGSNSWGDDTAGQYDLSCAEFDALVRDADGELPGEQAFMLEFSAGNAGPATQTMDSPAVAKNVLATGSVDNDRYGFGMYDSGQEVVSDFSSRGPAQDGRIKPDVVAPGTWISSIRSIFADDNNAWSPISDRYLYMGGTSQAGPHASGAAAVVVQWYRETHGNTTPSPALIKAILINSADAMGTAVIPDSGGLDGSDEAGSIVVGNTGAVPNGDEGWGRINLLNLIETARGQVFVDQGAGLATGQTAERKVVVGPGDELKVTLVYTDAPGLPAAIPALVNDLDLEVVSPGGALYRGNAIVEGESVSGTVAGDRLNNVEAVLISSPEAGEWTVRVRGVNVVQDVHKSTTGAPTQDFALVVSGQLPAPGQGVVSWDRAAYRAPGQATVRLTDTQLAGQSQATVTVGGGGVSTPLTLTPVGTGGSFAGTVSLATNSAAAGALVVKDGDVLTVVYHDVDPAGDRSATATIDLQPPLISDVQVNARYGRVTITWTTGEPANTAIYYGLTNAVTNVVVVPGNVEQHSYTLPPLTADSTYYFYVASTDAAGNGATNLLDGRLYYRFVAPKPISALLVYAPEAYFADGTLSDTPYPGIENWTSPLDALGIEYEVWDTSVEGRAPTAAELAAYRVVLWRPEELQAPTSGIIPALSAYVQSGGSLFVASFDLLTRLGEMTPTNDFRTAVLHVAGFTTDGGAAEIHGVTGDPVGGGLNATLSYDGFPSGFIIDLLGIDWTQGADHLTLMTNASPAFLQEDQRIVGMHYPKTGGDSTNGRVVFCSFALEAVPDDGSSGGRAALLGNALRFLKPELVNDSIVAFDQAAYTVPGNVVVEAIDSKRAGEGQVSVSVANGTQSQTLALAETVRSGVFRGRLTLDPQAQAGGQLPAKNGDTLRAIYTNSAKVAVTAEASVDTVKPAITQVASDPSYNEAWVGWTTDKAADALVRFGESSGDSALLTRTAYVSEFSTQHEVQLQGLLPDKTYYFLVISRDAAGNFTIDSRSNQLYSLRTLTPLSPPWKDPLDQADPGWAVYNDESLGGVFNFGDDEDTGVLAGQSWQFGVPANDRGVTAHTGTNVWATNLKGESVDFAMTDLISPALSLVGGTQATLRFWQYYDFSSAASGSEDDYFGDFAVEAGQVALSTDNGATWKDLYATSAEASSDWEEVEIDLSKYAGQVVRFRFNYQLFSFGTTARLGWMIDDPSVEMTVVPDTGVRVLSNLAQAAFVLSGGTNGLSIAGSGRAFETNLPPGVYTVTWRKVAYYTTPTPQTNTLATSGAILFQGNYTFPDANQNGLSDLWEERYFGTASTNHPATLDSDGDGASDLAEFLAGTDPTSPDSVLRLSGPLTQPNHTVRFEWPTTAGRDYQLQVSNDLVQWVTVGPVQHGTGATLAETLSALDPRLNYYFRVQATP